MNRKRKVDLRPLRPFALLSAFAASTSHAQSLEAVAARSKQEHSESTQQRPEDEETDARATIDAVGKQAWRHSACRESKRALSSLSTRMRWSVLLPNVRLGISQGIGATFNYASLEDTLGRSNLWLEARGTWDLDKLLYRPDEWRVLHEDREIERCRQKLVEDTREIFVRWLKLVRAGDAPEDALLLETTLNERTAGWFRQAVKYSHGRLSIHHEDGRP